MDKFIFNNIEFYKTNYLGYYVSKCGLVCSVRSKAQRKRQYGTFEELDFTRPRLLKLAIDKDGYGQVSLSINKKMHYKRSHMLVLETFIPKPDNINDWTVDHINCIKLDNRLENLRWLTRSSNTSRARSGTRPKIARRVVLLDVDTLIEEEYSTVSSIMHGSLNQIYNLYLKFCKSQKIESNKKYSVLAVEKGQETIEIMYIKHRE